MKTAVIGSGNMGTALARLLADNGHSVVCWDHMPEVVDDNAVGMGRFSTKKSKLHIPFVYGPKKINKFKRRTKFNKKRDSKLNYKDYEAIKNLDLDDEYAEMLNKWLSELQ